MDQLELKKIETIGNCYTRYAITREDGTVAATVIINANTAPASIRVYHGNSNDPGALAGRIEIPE